ncbi:BRO1 domain-containing protein BROX [Fasciolopsis buskii]|uniref:BRO1 domain-containing protein BROX n=1 Tax=Fasciolopsis buskii TaxID=27845 RepID=A0A8E0VII0_9TREM|nr:BRO1 domain-containing protein BROX [Fasciolopsis buski]
MSAKPAEHCFFRRLGTQVTQTRRKLERENGLIYHQRVPASAPAFTLKAEYGIAEPMEPDFDFTPSERWKSAYVDFDLKKMAEDAINRKARSKHSTEKTDSEAPVEPVHEKPIFPTDKDPKNESGCVLS